MKQYELQNADELAKSASIIKDVFNKKLDQLIKLTDMVVNITHEHFDESIKELEWLTNSITNTNGCVFTVDDPNKKDIYKIVIMMSEGTVGNAVNIKICQQDEISSFIDSMLDPQEIPSPTNIPPTATIFLSMLPFGMGVNTGINIPVTHQSINDPGRLPMVFNPNSRVDQQAMRFITDYYMAIVNMLNYANEYDLI